MDVEQSDLLGEAHADATSNGVQITTWDGPSIDALSKPQQVHLAAIVDVFGRLSAKAQGLPAPVTDLERTRLHGHVLYLASNTTGSRTQVLGGLKIGCKRLFLHSPQSKQYLEMSPDCVLDFYVHESCQRAGIGRTLLETFLRESGKTAAMLAYDRPSPKLKSFLAKHYGLVAYQPQINNYVVFNEFFHAEAAKQQSRCRKVLQVEAIASLALGQRSASSPPAISPKKPQAQAASPPPARPAMVRATSSAVDIDAAGARAANKVAALAAAVPAADVLPADRRSPSASSLYGSRSPPLSPAMTMRAAGISQGPPAGQWRMPAAASLARGLSAPHTPTVACPQQPPVPVVPATTSNHPPADSQPDVGTAAQADQTLRGASPPRQQQRQGPASPMSAKQQLIPSPSKSVSQECASPLGSPLRTPWALHIAEDTKDVVSRLQPAARRADLIRSPARRPLQPYQIGGSVASR